MRGPFLRHRHGSATRGRLGNAGGPSTGHGREKTGAPPAYSSAGVGPGGLAAVATAAAATPAPVPARGRELGCYQHSLQGTSAAPHSAATGTAPSRGGRLPPAKVATGRGPAPRTPSPGRKRKGLPGPPGDRDAEALPGGAAFPALAGPRKPRRPYRALQPGLGPAMRETPRPAGEQLPGRGA